VIGSPHDSAEMKAYDGALMLFWGTHAKQLSSYWLLQKRQNAPSYAVIDGVGRHTGHGAPGTPSEKPPLPDL
jgi:hypothetical protein